MDRREKEYSHLPPCHLLGGVAATFPCQARPLGISADPRACPDAVVGRCHVFEFCVGAGREGLGGVMSTAILPGISCDPTGAGVNGVEIHAAHKNPMRSRSKVYVPLKASMEGQ